MNELRFALRQLLRSPGFTTVTVLTLALGIGANSAMFGLVDAVLFRALPVTRPEQLVRMGMTDSRGLDLGGVSYPMLLDLRREAHAFAGIAGSASGSEVNLSVGDEPVERVSATTVTGNFFALLGVRAAAGRLLDPQDDLRPSGHPVMVLSEAFWQRRFGGDPRVIGKAVRLNASVFTIVGVAARGFHGHHLEPVPEIWVPLTMAVEVSPNLAQFKPFERRGFTWVELTGRLQEGVGATQARAQLDAIHTRLNALLKIPAADERYDRFRVLPLADSLLDPGRQEQVTGSSRILIGVTGLVQVVACAVGAGLLLVRSERRRRELAVRQALGASRWRIARQLLAECALLSASAAAVGVLLAAWTADVLQGVSASNFPLPTGAMTPMLEARGLGFAAALAVVSTLAFGALPAWRASRPNLVETMRVTGAAGVDRRPWLSLPNAFVVVQVALSTVLLVGAGLLVRTLGEATRVDLGFDTEDALVVSLDVSKSGYDRQRGRQFYTQLLDRVRQLPGVRSAALARHVPVQNAAMITSVELTNVTLAPGQEPRVMFTPVSPGFFATLGVRLERGRDFTREDETGASMLIVNRAFADRFWPGRDPLRERVLNFGQGGAEVIAVVGNAKQTSVRESAEPMIYVPDFAFYTPATNLVLRSQGPPRALVPAVTAVVRDLDRNVPLFRVRTLADHVGLALAQERTFAGLLSAFGLLALLLAAVGLYGLIAYTTQLRTREFGIRLALGAAPKRLVLLVLGQGAGLAGGGLMLGLGVAAGASRVLSAMLFGVSPTDSVTFGAISALLLVVALGAAALPARRAASVDPVTALRAE